MIYKVRSTNKKRNNPEDQIQTVIVQALRFFGFIVFSIPNGTYKAHPASREAHKKTGLMSGVADLQILLPNGQSVFVEVKTKTGRQQETQKEFEQICNKLGHTYLLWRSANDAEGWINENKSKIRRYK